jgi:hypothetical protein
MVFCCFEKYGTPSAFPILHPTEFCLLRPNAYRSVFGLTNEATSHRFVDRTKVRAVIPILVLLLCSCFPNTKPLFLQQTR